MNSSNDDLHPLNIFDIFSCIAQQFDDVNMVCTLFEINHMTASFRFQFVFANRVSIQYKVLNVRCSNVKMAIVSPDIIAYYDDVRILKISSFYDFNFHRLPCHLISLKVYPHAYDVDLIQCIEQSQTLQTLHIKLSGNYTFQTPVHVKYLCIRGKGKNKVQLNADLETLNVSRFELSRLIWNYTLVNLTTLKLPQSSQRMPWQNMPHLACLHVDTFGNFLQFNHIPESVHTLNIYYFNVSLIMPSHIKTLNIHMMDTSFDQIKSQLEHVKIDTLTTKACQHDATFSLPATVITFKCNHIMYLPRIKYDCLERLELRMHDCVSTSEYSNKVMPRLTHLCVSKCVMILEDSLFRLKYLRVHRLNEYAKTFQSSQLRTLHVNKCTLNDFTDILPLSLKYLIIDQCDYKIEQMILPSLPHLKYVQFKHEIVPITKFKT